MKLTLLAAAALGALTMILSPGGIREAGAMCASPKRAVLPASGTPLPPQPTLYAFIPHHDLDARLVIEGAEASIEPVAKSDAYDVVRVRVHARAPGHEFRLYWRDANGRTSRPASYRVGVATPPNQARVVGVTRHTRKWTCSFADTIKLELQGTAIAYRVAWADGSTTFLPADDRLLWRRNADEAAAPAPDRTTEAELGHLDCMGYSVDPEALARPRSFVLYALYADGSEVRIGSAVAQLGEKGVRLPIELVGNDGDGDGDGEIAPQRVISAAEAWAAAAFGDGAEAPEPAFGATAWQALLRFATGLGMLVGVVALVGAALLRRRRDHAPRL